MRCLYCGNLESKVVDSRSTDDGTAIRRRRECLNCGRRFTTYEKIESVPIIVVKKDGSRQPYDREKLQRGIMNACASRPVSIDMVDHMLDEIETTVHNSLEREVSSVKIGEMVMDRLRKIDEVSYVRFASVYKQFKDIDTFKAELEKLVAKSRGDDKKITKTLNMFEMCIRLIKRSGLFSVQSFVRIYKQKIQKRSA